MKYFSQSIIFFLRKQEITLFPEKIAFLGRGSIVYLDVSQRDERKEDSLIPIVPASPCIQKSRAKSTPFFMNLLKERGIQIKIPLTPLTGGLPESKHMNREILVSRIRHS